MPPTNNKKPVRKKKSEEVVIVTDLGRQQPQAVDFEEVVDVIGGGSYYCKVALDGSYLSIDTNPSDI